MQSSEMPLSAIKDQQLATGVNKGIYLGAWAGGGGGQVTDKESSKEVVERNAGILEGCDGGMKI